MGPSSTGPEHRNTLVSRNRLAMTHHRAGDLNRAIPLLKSALAVYERILSPRHGEAVPLQQVRPCLSPVGLPPQHQLPPRKPVPVERSGPWNPSNGSARENTNIPPGVSRRATSGNSSSGSVNHTAPTPSSSHRSRPRPQPETRMPWPDDRQPRRSVPSSPSLSGCDRQSRPPYRSSAPEEPGDRFTPPIDSRKEKRARTQPGVRPGVTGVDGSVAVLSWGAWPALAEIPLPKRPVDGEAVAGDDVGRRLISRSQTSGSTNDRGSRTCTAVPTVLPSCSRDRAPGDRSTVLLCDQNTVRFAERLLNSHPLQFTCRYCTHARPTSPPLRNVERMGRFWGDRCMDRTCCGSHPGCGLSSLNSTPGL
jgi:Tetratricopeptide repeat